MHWNVHCDLEVFWIGHPFNACDFADAAFAAAAILSILSVLTLLAKKWLQRKAAEQYALNKS